MTSASTHVLDAARGLPAAGLTLALHGPAGELLAGAVTDAEGRVRLDVDLAPGPHALVFDTGAWFAAAGRETFFPSVTLGFAVAAGDRHHHVALLLSPFAYTTYRGS